MHLHLTWIILRLFVGISLQIDERYKLKEDCSATVNAEILFPTFVICVANQ